MPSLLHPLRTERGYAMLGTIALVGLFAAAAVTTHLGTDALGNRQTNITAIALAHAKQALISRATSDGNHPGSLPCPDAVTSIPGVNVPNDGVARNLEMPATYQSLPLTLRATASAPTPHAVVVPVYDGDTLTDLPTLDAATGGELGRARARGEFQGKPYELFQCPAVAGPWAGARVIAVGAGPREQWNRERARRVATTAGLAARGRKLVELDLLMRGLDADGAGLVQAAAEGITLANFDAAKYRTSDPTRTWLTHVAVVVPDAPVAQQAALQAALRCGGILGEASNIARSLANEPSNALTPSIFADHAAALAQSVGLEVDVQIPSSRTVPLSMNQGSPILESQPRSP